jgi:hypothetical protein
MQTRLVAVERLEEPPEGMQLPNGVMVADRQF